jgi:hypothetical protein
LSIDEKLSIYDTLELWDDLKVVAKALDDAGGTNMNTWRVEMQKPLPVEKRKERSDAWARLRGMTTNNRQAIKERNLDLLKELEPSLEQAATFFGEIGDVEGQSYALAEIGESKLATEQQLEALRIFDQIDQNIRASGIQGWKLHGEIQGRIEGLKAQGFDPTAEPGTGPSGNTGSSWSDDPLGQAWSDPEPVRVVVDETLPFKFSTPGFTSSENTLAWKGFGLAGNGPSDFDDRFQPFAQRLRVSRDGVKLFWDDGSGKPIESRILAKPTLVELKKTVKDFDGNDVKLEYAFLIACGSEQESLFGMSVNLSPSADNIGIRYHSGCYLKSRVLGQDVLIFDDNMSGRFGDPIRTRLGTNAEQPEFSDNDAMMVGKEKVAGPWTEYIEKDGAFFRLKLNPDELTLVTRKLSVDTGTVKLNWDAKGAVEPEVVIIEETREFKGAFFAIGKQPVNVPVGTYRLSYGIIRKGSKTAQKSCLILPGKSTSFDVKKGEEAVVELGGPFTFDFKTEQMNTGDVKVLGKTVIVYGRSNEMYCHFRDEPPIPDKVQLRIKGGAPAGKAQSMGKATLDDFNKDQLSVWQPLDLVLPGSPGKSYEAQLSLKKNSLLGGPIKSEWQG